MFDRTRLPVTNDRATKEELMKMCDELMSLETDIDLREELSKLPSDVQKTLLRA